MNSLELAVLSVCCISAISLIAYYLFIFTKLGSFKPTSSNQQPNVSIIISARNERKNLEKNLASILEQDYPIFEVIVVNDGSFDGTKALVEEMQSKYSHLRLVDLNLDERYRKGKKFALTMGIKAAKYDQLLFTDADCIAQDHWISSMMNAKDDKDIILGYAPLNQKISLTGAMSYYETFHTALQYFSYALKGNAYMAVGRNLSYVKELFFKNKGFATHQHLQSGDDDLFIQEVATKSNVSICIEESSFMYSDGPKNLGAFIKQKMRHISTSPLYKSKYKRLLGYYSLMQILFLVGIIAAVFFPKLWIYAASVVAFKWIIQWIVMFKATQILKAKFIGYFLPFYDIVFSLYLLLMALIRPFYKNKEWK